MKVDSNVVKGLIMVPVLIVGGIIGFAIGSRIKDKVYNKEIETHDKKTAKRLSNQFKKELDDIYNRYNLILWLKDKENAAAKQSIIDLCKKYNVPEDEILKACKMSPN